MGFDQDKETVDALLNDAGFRKIVEADIGLVHLVQVDWEKNQINFYGEKCAKGILIDATLATLRGQFQ